MHEKPQIAQKGPYFVDVEEGKKYWFCTCGLSKKQPFCDGAHKTESCLKPILYEAQASETVVLCGCKHSKDLPFCDGTHGTV